MKRSIATVLLASFAVLLVSLPLVAVGDGTDEAEDSPSAPRIIRESPQPEGFPEPTAVGEIVVKDYPAYRSAKVARGEANRNSMFRSLFRHITRNDVSMTAPVEMTYDEDGPTSMSFLYGSLEIGEPGEDGVVEVADQAAATVVAIGVRGSYTQQRYEENLALLTKWLAANADQWEVVGEPRQLSFNSPFVPGVMKYSEVQIPIRAVE